MPAKETNWGEIAFFWSRKKSKVTNEVLCQAKIKLILNNGRNNDRGDDWFPRKQVSQILPKPFDQKISILIREVPE